MGANVTEISGATEIELYFRNYTYATALSDLDPLEMVNFTDLDRVGYKNTSGSIRKFMEDSTTNSNIPANRILYTDANGRATSNSGLTFDGTSLALPAFQYGWSFHVTSTKMEIYKDGAPIGIVLAEI